MLYLLGGRSVEIGGGEIGWPLCFKLASISGAAIDVVPRLLEHLIPFLRNVGQRLLPDTG